MHGGNPSGIRWNSGSQVEQITDRVRNKKFTDSFRVLLDFPASVASGCSLKVFLNRQLQGAALKTKVLKHGKRSIKNQVKQQASQAADTSSSQAQQTSSLDCIRPYERTRRRQRQPRPTHVGRQSILPGTQR